MKRFGSAAWSGNLRDGKGTVSTESHALDSYPYTFFSRYGEKPGTNPEELLGAAHAACFAMSFVRMLEMSHFEGLCCMDRRADEAHAASFAIRRRGHTPAGQGRACN